MPYDDPCPDLVHRQRLTICKDKALDGIIAVAAVCAVQNNQRIFEALKTHEQVVALGCELNVSDQQARTKGHGIIASAIKDGVVAPTGIEVIRVVATAPFERIRACTTGNLVIQTFKTDQRIITVAALQQTGLNVFKRPSFAIGKLINLDAGSTKTISDRQLVFAIGQIKDQIIAIAAQDHCLWQDG